MSDPSTTASHRRLLNATTVMASGTAISRLLGVVRAVLIAYILGNATMRADVFTFALTVPNSLYLLLAGGTLNNVLVPQIVRAVNHDPDGGKAFVDRIMTGFLIVLGALTVVFTIAAPLVMSVYTNARWREPELAEQWRSLILMSYITMPQIFFYGVFFLIGQILNARDLFGPMMWAPILNNIVAIATLGSYLAIWGSQASSGGAFTDQQVWWLGLGSTLGIITQTVVLLPFLKRAGFTYRPRFDLKGTGLGRTFHVAKWMVGYVALTSLAQVVVTNLASTAAPSGGGSAGGINVYQNAYLIWILPHSLLTVSLATAMLPAASRFAVAGNTAGVAAETNRALRLALTFIVPVSVAFALLADPITRVPFGNGVGASDYHFVAWALAAFAIGLVPYTFQYLQLRAFYALDNTRTPFLLQIWISGANALLAIGLVLAWQNPETVAARLALAYSLAYVLGALLTHRALRRRLPDLEGAQAWRYVLRLLWATLPAAALAWAITWWFAGYPSAVVRIIGLALAGLLAVLAFFFTAKRLGIPEATTLLDVLRRRRGDEGESDAVEAIVEDAEQEDDQRRRVAGPDGFDRGDGASGQDGTAGSEMTGGSGEAGRASGAALWGSDFADGGDTGSGHPGSSDLTNTDPDGTGVFVAVPRPPALREEVLYFPEPPVTALQPVEESFDGRLLGDRYRLAEQLAVRGSTQTWRAHDSVLGRPVLVHLLPAGDPATTDALRLAREWAAATDSRFLRVLDVVENDPTSGPYLVYEYSAGQSLAKVLGDGPLTGVETAWIVREIADAMIALHAQGRYHRQLSPATLLVTGSGNVKVLGPGVTDARFAPAPDGEAADVRALGRILYACLVLHWPEGTRFGLPAAPLRDGRLLPAAEVRPGVPPALDAITDRVLSSTPRGNATRITTVQELTTQLSLVLGPMSAAVDLGQRLHPAASQPPTPISKVAPPLPTPAATRFSASASLPAEEADAEDDFVEEALNHSDNFTPVPPPVVGAGGDPERPRTGRLPLLFGFIGLVLAVGLIAAFTVTTRPVAVEPAVTKAAPLSFKADDFDPKADGGSGAENSKQVPLASDGDAETAWLTERYRKLPSFGGLKPGVGLVLDLGSTRTVRQVVVEFEGSETAVEVRVPVKASETAPKKSSSQWTPVAALPEASGKTTIEVDTKTRFLLVYLTSLPSVGDGYFRGGVAEVSVLGG